MIVRGAHIDENPVIGRDREFGIAQVDTVLRQQRDRLPIHPIARTQHADYAIQARDVPRAFAERAVQVIAVRNDVGKRGMRRPVPNALDGHNALLLDGLFRPSRRSSR